MTPLTVPLMLICVMLLLVTLLARAERILMEARRIGRAVDRLEQHAQRAAGEPQPDPAIMRQALNDYEDGKWQTIDEVIDNL